ncbi:MAG: hypothetical protein A3G57_00665 [Candidatus Andersenbacteria bacterium RIFCSPLOWO2_12_FULL_45_8]|nr:MAG: hypothetical protein UW94_C0005G0019 [Parcubacteria group bacterium GW2011_GWA2_45_14]OGY35515.1 MAG: hypothetical protein A3B76_01940 [Candidatus Andersenbacteria bacterium RIFCSPHIGHO2_02_FULL_46_16]OGY36502.1 MAG: hypothetical protein A3I08_00795 [Candidatus Andersenbacteria bacterium RIFCSPLOWO2_02_FULL_46_11]OGY41489.1 MAG: hypothetical protein A3G57_00665 [Candidatus Andersenbacteria bacterium RIFCSPLOWO2_12_FULL_45_8]HBE90740.1 hypothetical protein [Candidatus Andersenbacteria ba
MGNRQRGKFWKLIKQIVKGAEDGVTVVELLVFIGIGSVLIATLAVIVSGTSRVSRQQMEQGVITEKARVQLERISDEIRNAQYVDCNLDSDTADVNEYWLYGASDWEIIVLSNVDDDVEAERVRYFVQASTTGETKKLKRAVTQPGASLCDFSPNSENITTVLDGLVNVTLDPDRPLFQYFMSGQDAARLTTPVIRLSSVLRVRLHLVIDEDINTDPALVEVVTDVVPRGVEDPGACVINRVDFYRYHMTESFADAAFISCQSHCLGIAVLPPGECCPWSTAFYLDSATGWVWSTCQCADTYLPPDIIPENVNLNQYTSSVRGCLDGTRCAGLKGEAVCEAGCLDTPGECVCVCPAGLPPTTACNDGVDNDGDGTADCSGCGGVAGLLDDPGCSGYGDSSEWGTTQCDDGIDNDGCNGTDFKINGTGDIDCVDPADDDEGPCLSGSPSGCVPTQIPSIPQCSDELDNDCAGDGIDYAGGAGDLQCQNINDNNEWSINKQCNDGFDNDADGTVDCWWLFCARLRPDDKSADTDCTGPNDDSEFSDV